LISTASIPGNLEMTILGKILLFFNIIAAGAVVYFATQSWTIRQTENATALKYYLWIQGLPQESPPIPPLPTDPKELEEFYAPLGTEADPFRMGPSHSVYSVRYEFLKKHFEGADKGTYSSPMPPNSRSGEFKRVREVLENSIESMKTETGERLNFLVGKYVGSRFEPGLLVLLADSFEEREAYRSLIKKPSDADAFTPEKIEANTKLARKALTNKFDAITNPPSAAALAEETTKLQEKYKRVQEADEEAKAANTRLKAATKAYRELYEPLLAKSVEMNFLADAATKAALETARKEQDAAYEAFLKKNEAKRAAELELLELQAGTRSAATDEPDRLRRTIQLLMVLDKGESWQRRLVLVFGLGDYLTALKDRVERHSGARPYAPRLKQKMDEETVEFIGNYERFKEVAIDRDRQLYRQKEITDALFKQLEKSKEELEQTKTQHAMKAADLNAIETEVAKLIAKQTMVEAELFDVQKQIGDMLRLNFEMEDKLQTTERKLISGR
jgi:hypothetical protein